MVGRIGMWRGGMASQTARRTRVEHLELGDGIMTGRAAGVSRRLSVIGRTNMVSRC